MSLLFSAQPLMIPICRSHSPSSSSSGIKLPVCPKRNFLFFRHGLNIFQLEDGWTWKLIFPYFHVCVQHRATPSFYVETGPIKVLMMYLSRNTLDLAELLSGLQGSKSLLVIAKPSADLQRTPVGCDFNLDLAQFVVKSNPIFLIV